MKNSDYGEEQYEVEKVVSADKVNMLSLVAYFIIFFPLTIHIIIQFNYMGGLKNTLETWNVIYAITFPVIYLILVALHEIIHAIGFWLFGKVQWKNIKFGIIKGALMPYTHCENVVHSKAYGLTLLLPTLILGIVPFVIGLIERSILFYFYGAIMIVAGLGDFLVYLKVRKIPKDSFVIDHSDKIGFKVLTKKAEASR